MTKSPVNLSEIFLALLDGEFKLMSPAEFEDSPGVEGTGYHTEINGCSIILDHLAAQAVIQVCAEDGECFQTELTLSPMEDL